MATQSSYGLVLNDAINTFVTKFGRLSGSVDIRGFKDLRPRALIENLNSVTLLFKDYYKHDNKNPIAKYLNYSLGGVNSKINKIKREKMEELMNFRKKVEAKKDKLLGYKRDDDDDGYKDYRVGKGRKIPIFKNDQNVKINNTTDDILDLNSLWNQFEKGQKKVEETPQRTEAKVVVNGYYENIKIIVKGCVRYIFASLFCMAKRECF